MGLPASQHAADGALLPGPVWLHGKVLAVLSRDAVRVACAGQEQVLAVATHLPLLIAGQRVLAVSLDEAAALVIAAFPLHEGQPNASAADKQQPPLMHFDVATGTLCLQAPQLRLQGIASVELHCGDAVLRINAQGEIFSQAQAITQSAIGAHRIEGASVDIN